MDFDCARISLNSGLNDFDQPTVGTTRNPATQKPSHMTKRTPNPDNSAEVKSKRLNIILWVTIALFTLLIGAWTIWASNQPNIRSIWAPE